MKPSGGKKARRAGRHRLTHPRPSKGKGVPTPPIDRDYILQRDGGKCLRCGSTESLTMDHVKPLSLGGDWSYSNLQTLCRDCNGWKASQHIDFRPSPPNDTEPI